MAKPTEYHDTDLLLRRQSGETVFAKSRLNGINLRKGHFQGCDFSASTLRGVNLGEAELQGVNLERSSLNGTSFFRANLTEANLSFCVFRNVYGVEGKFRFADLRTSTLKHTALTGADLTGANLSDSIFQHGDLKRANFTNATLTRATLKGVRLEQVRFTNADLDNASFKHAVLKGTTFRGARAEALTVGGTSFIDTDLALFCRAETRHSAPSTVDFRSVVRSAREPRLKEFLRRTGMPDIFVEYMIDCARALDGSGAMSLLRSTFISYGSPDEAFVRKLNDALEKRGVTTFFFKDDARPGVRLHRMMRQGVNEYDRVILVCSKGSLDRRGLLNELEETLAREARDGGEEYLIPVRLDGYVLDGWTHPRHDIVQAVRDRVVADFTEHDIEPRFEAELAKLIEALKRPIVYR